jgi:hypothetical protein
MHGATPVGASHVKRAALLIPILKVLRVRPILLPAETLIWQGLVASSMGVLLSQQTLISRLTYSSVDISLFSAMI